MISSSHMKTRPQGTGMEVLKSCMINKTKVDGTTKMTLHRKRYRSLCMEMHFTLKLKSVENFSNAFFLMLPVVIMLSVIKD